MATRFEIALYGADPVALRAAAEEAFDEVERIEGRLSLYRADPEIARVNALAHRQPVRVSPPVFGLLERARQLNLETAGAFDISVAPLVRCWGLMRGAGRVPSPDELARARACTGMHLVHLDSDALCVRFDREGVMLDLGAIGKGYAVEKAAELLRDAGVTSALLHGGTSTIYALGHPPDQAAWKVALEMPSALASPVVSGREEASDGGTLNATVPRTPLAVVPLKDESLSVSAVWGKGFAAGGKTYGHVLDPRTGAPAEAALMAAVVLPSATETDALSTALLVFGPGGGARIAASRPGVKTFVVHRAGGELVLEHDGIEPLPFAPGIRQR
jgi:FAD:protein FMN transferase